MTAVIVTEPRRAPRRRRFATRPRGALAGFVAFAVLSAGVAVAATQLFIPTHTHQYVPKGMAVGGGPGELLNLNGTDFRQIALRIASDIPYPAGYGSWRTSVISSEYEEQQDACREWNRIANPARAPGCTPKAPAGQLHGAFAASAFCAWVLTWRHDMMAGRQAAAARDTRVISGALRWKAVTDWDPHPSMSVPGDGGTTHPSAFGWMIPFIRSVGTGDLARVDNAIVSDAKYGGQFALWVNTGLGLNLQARPRWASTADLPRSPRPVNSSREATERLFFERQVKETREDLLAYTMRRTASPEDAADVLSETYLIAWRKLGKIPPGDSARLWLFGVAANVLRRGAQYQRAGEALIERLASEPHDTVRTESSGREDSSIGALRAGLASLPPRDREILTLTAWEGLTPKQIAAVTGLPTNVVRVRLHRARSRLKRRLTHTQMTPPDTETAILSARSGSH